MKTLFVLIGISFVLAAILLHERLGGRQRLGALGALAGVALIAAG